MISCQIKKALHTASGPVPLEIDWTIEKGSFTTLYGPSGAGKTTLLRILAGLLRPDSGSIVVDKTTWYNRDSKTFIPPQRRQVGLVFQEYALFPNMTVAENLAFALAKNQHKDAVEELVDIMELQEFLQRKPEQLSGGQKQRVALARALVPKPKILLLDEPLSALDRAMRSKLQDYLLSLHRRYELTTVLVSHDSSEILKTSDTMVVLENGQIVKKGHPSKVLTGQELSGKFQFSGEITSMDLQGFLCIISVLIGNDLVKVVADTSEVQQLQVGDKILVASKAFNPVIKKL